MAFPIITTKDLKVNGIVPPIDDPLFGVRVLGCYDDPLKVIYQAMHQDYSSDWIGLNPDNIPAAEKLGQILIKRLLAGERGHFGPLEHVQLTLSTGFFPHSTMQQFRTHRIATFDVQSFRYTSESILELANAPNEDFIKQAEKAFYLRPVGSYTSRDGKKYAYTQEQRDSDIVWNRRLALRYRERFEDFGFSEEHCRGFIASEYRQHFVLSANLRSWMHLIDMRAKADAAPEIRTMAEMAAIALHQWSGEIMDWYDEKRMRRAKLAP